MSGAISLPTPGQANDSLFSQTVNHVYAEMLAGQREIVAGPSRVVIAPFLVRLQAAFDDAGWDVTTSPHGYGGLDCGYVFTLKPKGDE